MKVNLQGTIQKMYRGADPSEGYVYLDLFLKGKVESSSNISAKEAEMTGTLRVKAVVANELKIGSTISVVLYDGIPPYEL